jgi:LPS export ABC transporter protein LptC
MNPVDTSAYRPVGQERQKSSLQGKSRSGIIIARKMKLQLKYLPVMAIISLFAVIGFFLIKAAYKGAEDMALTELVPEESLRLENIHYIQDNPDEGAKWILDADEIKFSKDMQHISFNNFRFKLEPENNFTIDLVGSSGDFDRTAGEINLRGNLEGHTENGYRISTDHILYKQKEGNLSADGPVEIDGPFFSVTGSGLQVNLEKETIRIISNTKTSIKRGSLML